MSYYKLLPQADVLECTESRGVAHRPVLVASTMRYVRVEPHQTELIERLDAFPESLEHVKTLLEEVTGAVEKDSSDQMALDTSALYPGAFAKKWLSDLKEAQHCVLIAAYKSNVADDVRTHILGFAGISQEIDLAMRFQEYAPVVEALLANPETSTLENTWFSDAVPRYLEY